MPGRACTSRERSPINVASTIRFDAIVLLSAPAEVLLSRIANRRTNRYGKLPAEQELILRHLVEVEPVLRRTCVHELDATEPLAMIVDQLVEVGREPTT
jgi:hypothetical protein